MTNDTSLESSCALLLESAKKFANLQKLNFLSPKSSYVVKMFAKTNLSKKEILYLCNPFSYVKGFPKAKFYQNLTSESGSKQRFSLLPAKAVTQAVCLRS